MKQFSKITCLGCLLLLITTIVSAQRRNEALPQPEVFAKMILDEKKARQFSDSLYVTYFVDSLGFMLTDELTHSGKMMHQYAARRGIDNKCFVKKWDKGVRNGTIEIILSSQAGNEDGKLLRSITIQSTDHTKIYWIVMRLKVFGLKQTEGGGDFIDLKGKGLYAGTGREQSLISGLSMYTVRIGCWFDKK